MKLPRRRFLHLAASAAAVPTARGSRGGGPIRRDRCAGSSHFRRAVAPTSCREPWRLGCRTDLVSRSSSKASQAAAPISERKRSSIRRLTATRCCFSGSPPQSTLHSTRRFLSTCSAISRRLPLSPLKVILRLSKRGARSLWSMKTEPACAGDLVEPGKVGNSCLVLIRARSE
jgi:hypothetical protein